MLYNSVLAIASPGEVMHIVVEQILLLVLLITLIPLRPPAKPVFSRALATD